MLKYFPYLLILIGAFARMLPHAPNFTPIAALALFGAVYLKKRDGLLLPLAAMIVSDVVVGFYHPLVMASVYGSFVLIGIVGVWLRRYRSEQQRPQYLTIVNNCGTEQSKKIEKTGTMWWPRVFGASLLGSVLFFLITNWAVWAWGTLYPRTLEGLMMSYWMGLPFFRNTLMGDLFYVGVFFGIAEFVPLMVKKRKMQSVAVK